MAMVLRQEYQSKSLKMVPTTGELSVSLRDLYGFEPSIL